MGDSCIFIKELEAGGCLLEVVLAPRSSSNRIVGVYRNRLKIAVTAPPVDGKANELLIKFLAKQLGCSKGSITLMKGHASKDKTLSIRGLEIEDLLAALDEALKDA